MTPKQFVVTYLPHALKVEASCGLSAIATLTQGALESAWGERAPGNMFFGVKDTDGINGNEQLITTTEYSKSDKLKFPVIISKVFNPVNNLWKYLVKDYFRKYNTAADCFADHAQFFQKNSRYAKAWTVRHDYNLFFEEIAKAGYATDPNYAQTLKAVAKIIVPLTK